MSSMHPSNIWSVKQSALIGSAINQQLDMDGITLTVRTGKLVKVIPRPLVYMSMKNHCRVRKRWSLKKFQTPQMVGQAPTSGKKTGWEVMEVTRRTVKRAASRGLKWKQIKKRALSKMTKNTRTPLELLNQHGKHENRTGNFINLGPAGIPREKTVEL